MISKIICWLTFLIICSAPVMAADNTNRGLLKTINGINIGNVRKAVMDKDVAFFEKNAEEASSLIVEHETLTGDYGILEMMFREAKNREESVPDLLHILFALNERHLFKRINDSTILYKLALDIQFISRANSKLFLALQACGVIWGKTIERFRTLSDFRYEAKDTDSYNKHNRVHMLFFDGMQNLKDSQTILKDLFIQAVRLKKEESARAILKFCRPFPQITLKGTDDGDNRSENQLIKTAQGMEKFMAIFVQNQDFALPTKPLLKENYRDQEGHSLLFDLVKEGELDVIKKVCELFPELKQDKAEGTTLCNLNEDGNIKSFLGKFFGLEHIISTETATTPTTINSANPSANGFIPNPITNRFPFTHLYKYLESGAEAQFKKYLKTQKDSEELLKALYQKVYASNDPSLAEKFKSFTNNFVPKL